MGCCGSSETKNAVSPAPSKGPRAHPDDIQIRVEAPDSDSDSDSNPSPPPFRRVKTARPPDPPKEIEIADKLALRGHNLNVDLCSWSPVEDKLVTAGTDRHVFLWSLVDFSMEEPEGKELDLDPSDGASCLHWSEDGQFLALGTERGNVTLFSNKAKRLSSWSPHSQATKAVKVNGDYVVSVSDIVCVFVISKKIWLRTAWNQSALTAVEWVSSQQYLVADFDGIITLDTVKESKFTELDFDFDIPADVPEHQFRSHTAGIYKLAKHPERSKIFASCSVDFTAKIWSLDHSKPLQTLEGHFGYVLDIAWINSDKYLLATGSYDGSVKIWDTKSGSCLRSLDEHRGQIAKIDVSNDGRYIVSGGHDGTIHFWSVDKGRLLNSYEGPGRMLQVGFNMSGGLVVASSFGVAEIIKLKYNMTFIDSSSRKRKSRG